MSKLLREMLDLVKETDRKVEANEIKNPLNDPLDGVK